jgi:hypothetical protein
MDSGSRDGAKSDQHELPEPSSTLGRLSRLLFLLAPLLFLFVALVAIAAAAFNEYYVH